MAAQRQIFRRMVWYSQRMFAGALYVQTSRHSQHVLKKITCPSQRSYSVRFMSSAGKNEQAIVFNVQSEEDFRERVKNSKVPVIVDFHATWCGPCKILGPTLEKEVDAKDGKVLLAKVDIDDLQDLAVFYGVKAVPTVIAMKNGLKVDEFVGVVDHDVIESFVENLVE